MKPTQNEKYKQRDQDKELRYYHQIREYKSSF